MPIALVDVPTDGSALGQLAEQLLLSERVGLRVNFTDQAISTLKAIPLDLLEELVHTNCFVLVHELIPMILELNKRSALDLMESAGGQRIGYVAPMLMTFGSFLDEFTDGTKAFLPNSLRDTLLSHLIQPAVDFPKLASLTRIDCMSPAVVTAAGVRGPDLDEFRRLTEYPKFKRTRGFDILGYTVSNIFGANYALNLAGLGLTPTSGSEDFGIIKAKLRMVFQEEQTTLPQDAFHGLLNLNSLPSVSSLVAAGQLNLRDIMSIRNSSEGRAFRQWFQTVTSTPNASLETVVQDYISMLHSATRKDPWVRRVGMFGLTQIAGYLDQWLGVTVSAVNDLVVPLTRKAQPFMLFDSLKQHTGVTQALKLPRRTV